MLLLLAAITLLDMRSNGPPEDRWTTGGRFRPAAPPSPSFTLHVHQDSSRLRDDEGRSCQVPHVHPDLVVRFHAARRHQAHVDGCGSGAAYAGDTDVQSQAAGPGRTLGQPCCYPCTGIHRMFLKLEKILSTTSGSRLDPNSVAMMDCLMAERTKQRGVSSGMSGGPGRRRPADLSAPTPAAGRRCRRSPSPSSP